MSKRETEQQMIMVDTSFEDKSWCIFSFFSFFFLFKGHSNAILRITLRAQLFYIFQLRSTSANKQNWQWIGDILNWFMEFANQFVLFELKLKGFCLCLWISNIHSKVTKRKRKKKPKLSNFLPFVFFKFKMTASKHHCRSIFVSWNRFSLFLICRWSNNFIFLVGYVEKFDK